MTSEGRQLPPGNQDHPMLNACSLGDVETLRRLFVENGIHPGSKPTKSECVDPRISYEAVAAKQLKIVNFILQTCPSLSLKQSFDVVDAVLDNPDPAILKALCDHEKNFASFSIDYHIHCFLTAACARPPAEIVPVLHVLLDNGGDVNDGQGSGGGALYAAIVGNQPLEIIKKVVSKGADVNFRCTGLAIEQGSLETVKYLFASGKIRYSFQVDATFEKAKKSGHAETIAAVQSWACERVERDAKSEEKATTKSNWQFWESWYG